MAIERTQAEIREICDKACEILKKTNDGGLLDPSDLKLTEYAVNGVLNDIGKDVFEKLHQQVMDGTYTKPYLHGIENITRDHEGYIYYKGNHVEHYNNDYVYSEAAKIELLELKRRCEFLERRGVEVSSVSAVWGWESHADEYGAERKKELDALIGKNALYYSRVEINNYGMEYSYFVGGAAGDLEAIKNHPVTQSMTGRDHDGGEYDVRVESYIYESEPRKNMLLPSDKTIAKIEDILPSCHGYFTKHGLLEEQPVVTYKTDFAENYEKTKELDSLLNSPGRSFEYSVVDIWGRNSNISRSYMYGTPALDEIKATWEYDYMAETQGVLSVAATTFQYGGGEPLKTEELPPFEQTEKILSELHDYLEKHDLSKEIRWENYTENLVVSRENNNSSRHEPEDEAEDGCEPD